MNRAKINLAAPSVSAANALTTPEKVTAAEPNEGVPLKTPLAKEREVDRQEDFVDSAQDGSESLIGIAQNPFSAKPIAFGAGRGYGRPMAMGGLDPATAALAATAVGTIAPIALPYVFKGIQYLANSKRDGREVCGRVGANRTAKGRG